MNSRENAMAVLNYENYDKLPIVHFGFWDETLEKWHQEGYLSEEEAKGWGDGNAIDKLITTKLGFDFNWYSCFHSKTSLFPLFERKIIEVMANGTRKVLNSEGVVVLEKDGVCSIPAEIEHTLKDRESWGKYYLPKLQYSEDRVDSAALMALKNIENRDIPMGIHCGSLFGQSC